MQMSQLWLGDRHGYFKAADNYFPLSQRFRRLRKAVNWPKLGVWLGILVLCGAFWSALIVAILHFMK
jgi:hypothetical protein